MPYGSPNKQYPLLCLDLVGLVQTVSVYAVLRLIYVF